MSLIGSIHIKICVRVYKGNDPPDWGFLKNRINILCSTENYRPDFSSEKAPTSLVSNGLKNNSRKKEKLVAGPRGVLDTKTDWPTDRQL
jgi:hypothetical protein